MLANTNFSRELWDLKSQYFNEKVKVECEELKPKSEKNWIWSEEGLAFSIKFAWLFHRYSIYRDSNSTTTILLS